MLLPKAISGWSLFGIDFGSGRDLDAGCTLKKPDDVKNHREAFGKPLMIFINVVVTGVRNIPDQGGSYGVDIK